MPRHPALRRGTGRAGLAALLLSAPLVAGCSQAGGWRAPIGEAAASSPASLVDGYLIARGMALSYGHSGRAGPAEITQLLQYDRAALIAVVTAQLEPGAARDRQAEQALAALVDFTGDNDLRPDPVLSAPPPLR